MKKKDNKGYNWTYDSVGGAVRVVITSGEDIKHLGELDKKKWTVLSSPTAGLEFDQKTLSILDTNSDGKIRTDEVVQAAQWLTDIVKNPDILLQGKDSLDFAEFNTESANGARLLASAKQILTNLGIEKESISLAETSDNTKIFADSLFNGDGIITAASAGSDEELAALVGKIAGTIGKATDRSGADGVTAEQIEAFYAAAADFKAWKDAAKAGEKEIFPYGEGTEAALAAVEAIKDKVADYFMRCKLIDFDGDVAGVVDVSAEKIGLISGENLSLRSEDIATYPLARPSSKGILPLEGGINPAWKDAVKTFKALVADVAFPKAEGIDEAQWNEIVAGFGPFIAWRDSKKGAEVEALGLEDIEAVLKADRKAALLELVEKDKALEAEALSIEEVDKLLHLVKNFYHFLCNYVSFTDFYSKDKDVKAIFQAGRLYIDQRSTDLCVKVADMGKQADVTSMSGMYILYCACTSTALGKSMNIAAVLTDGDVDDLRAGRNALFYDREGNSWDAVVTSIVENPISVRQAFWAPYKKVSRLVSDRIDKKAAEKESKSMGNLTAATDNATTAAADGKAPKIAAPFDIAKFAGIAAAMGMAFAFASAAVVGLFAFLGSLKFWQIILVIAVVMLLISGPSMFIAWRKLRKRNLGPLLNANGWAINANALVNTKFGKTLTEIVKYPKLTAVDPEARKKANLRRFIWTLIVLAAAALGFLFFTDRLACIGLPFHKPAAEQVEEAPAAAAVENAQASEAAPVAPAESE